MKKEMLEVGSKLNLGNYHGDLSWIVLDNTGSKALLISEKIIDCRKYYNESGRTNWGKSNIREWLNGEFFDEAFKDDEKSEIVKSTVTAEWNPDYKVSPGEDTMDNIFLPSISEAKKYLKDVNLRMCEATPYAVSNGAFVFDNGKAFWWLRTPGDDMDCAVMVHHDGYINFSGFQVKSSVGIRPMMWVKID